jgi:hypothetical protein
MDDKYGDGNDTGDIDNPAKPNKKGNKIDELEDTMSGLPILKNFQTGTKFRSFHRKLGRNSIKNTPKVRQTAHTQTKHAALSETPTTTSKHETKHETKTTSGKHETKNIDFSTAKDKKSLMAMYIKAVKQDPKNKEKLLESYLEHLIALK